MRKKMLVVEDDFLIRQLLKDFFEENGFEVVPVEDASGVLIEIMHNDFDIVISDYQLPDSFGPLLTKRIKKLKPLTPVIGISAFYCKQVFMQAGADDFFEKPFRLSTLKASVEYLTKDRETQ